MSKKKFTVEVTETLQRQVDVRAVDENEAEQIVRDMYRNEEIILSSDDYIDTEFEVLSSDKEQQTYYAELYDSEEDKTIVCVFETTKSLKEVKKAYDKARSDWYEEESPDCMFDYVQEKLDEQGIEFYQVEPDITLNF